MTTRRKPKRQGVQPTWDANQADYDSPAEYAHALIDWQLAQEFITDAEAKRAHAEYDELHGAERAELTPEAGE